MATVLRLIDANANRAREAMRVMEDAARFLLNDADRAGRLKRMRHDLAAALAPLGELALHRDTPGDVGTTLSTDGERRRPATVDVVRAAGKRLSEALRTIEEYLKTSDPDAAGRVEALRYQGYTLEAELVARLHRPDPRDWRLCIVLTESICHHPWPHVVAEALNAAGDRPERLCFQLREKDRPDADRLRMARQLVRQVHAHQPDDAWAGAERSPAHRRAAVIVNDRPDIALAAEADGVHLGQDDLPVDAIRTLAGGGLLIGQSTHDAEEARAAVEAGCDYCGVGAMFATATKPHVQPAGLDYLRHFLQTHRMHPHLAIGGIGPDNIDRVVHAGARAVAVSRCVCAAADPAGVVGALLANCPAEDPADP